MKQHRLILTAMTFFALCMVAFTAKTMAQKTMYVMRNGVVVFQSLVTAMDSMTFDAGVSLTVRHSADEKVNNVQKLTFSATELSVHSPNSAAANYAFGDIARLTFSGGSTGINSLQAGSVPEVKAYYAAGSVMVESSAEIKSLSLFDMYGKAIAGATADGSSSMLWVSGPAAGVYLLRVETTQGSTVKKLVINPLN